MGAMHSKAMSGHSRAWMTRSLWALFLVALLLALALTAYAAYLRRSAKALIDTAAQIRTAADAERQIAIWRQRLPRGYSESRSPDGAGRAYQVQIGNGLLSKLRLIPNTGALLQVTTFSGQLSEVLLGMY